MCVFFFFLFFFRLTTLCAIALPLLCTLLYHLRLMKDESVDTVDDAVKEREMPMEYQRVSISGEEKCGVRIVC